MDEAVQTHVVRGEDQSWCAKVYVGRLMCRVADTRCGEKLSATTCTQCKRATCADAQGQTNARQYIRHTGSHTIEESRAEVSREEVCGEIQL